MKNLTDSDRNAYFSKWLREHGIVCNCGGPQYGTDHSPDCQVELAWSEAMAAYDDENEEAAR